MEILEVIPQYMPYWWYILIMAFLFISAAFYIGTMIDEGIDVFGAVGHTIGLFCTVAFITMLVLGIIGKFSYYNGDKLIVRIDDKTAVSKIYEEYKITDHEKYTDIYTLFRKENK